MIVYLINNSIINGMLQIDLRIFILLHVIYIILGALLFRGVRRKYLRKLVPNNDDKNEQVESLNSELEPFGFAYNYKHDIFYSLMYCWQRSMGYCRFYDEAAAPLSMIIDCEPIHFNYNGKKWLIEFWKGQYGMTTGAEVGVYTTKNSKADLPDLFNDAIYDSVSDEERLVMSFSLKKGNKLLLYREGLHWWLTGFKLGEFTNPKSLLMEIRISFPNKSMKDAFVDALFEAGYSYENVFVKHYTVYIIFDRPHTKQPYSRTKLMQKFVLNSNKFYYKFYKFITRKYDNTLDKLQYLKVYSPFMYRRALSIGKTKEFYKDYERIKSFFNRITDENENEDENI